MWACHACTLINEEPAHAACAVCETPRQFVEAPTGFAGHKRTRAASTPSPVQPDPAELSESDGEGGMDMDEDDDHFFAFVEETEPTASAKRMALHDAPSVSASVSAEESMADAAMDAQLAKSFVGAGSATATRKLMHDYKSLLKLMAADRLSGIEVSMPDESNGYHWLAEFGAPSGTKFHKQLEAYAVANRRKPVVELEMLFDAEYPFSPPFVRVLRPRFSPRTGHVTSGGSICIELLTRSGWRPSYSIEALLVQLVALICSDEAHAELDRFSANRAYSIAEARSAFVRVAADHGWKA